MLGELVKRLTNLVVVALAAVTFFLVPFGQRTLFQHLRAVFGTREAAELRDSVEQTGEKVVEEVKGEVVAAPKASAKKPRAHAPPTK